jgi:predicted O-methyltransferase YrrM
VTVLDPGAWYDHDSARTLSRVCYGVKRRRVAVEFGGWTGTSAQILAANFATVMVVDPWEPVRGGPPEYQEAKEAYLRFLNATEHLPNLVRFRCSAEDFRQVYDGPLDLIHIDHVHTEQETAISILWALGLIRGGGVVCGHDYGHDDFPGVAAAVQRHLPDHHHEGLVWWKEVTD